MNDASYRPKCDPNQGFESPIHTANSESGNYSFAQRIGQAFQGTQTGVASHACHQQAQGLGANIGDTVSQIHNNRPDLSRAINQLADSLDGYENNLPIYIQEKNWDQASLCADSIISFRHALSFLRQWDAQIKTATTV